jgi:hypothetical protein
MAQSRCRTTNLILIGVLILGIILALTIQNWQVLGLSGGAVLALLMLLRVLPDLVDKPIKRRIKEERRADRGAASEEVVGNLLAGLSEDFYVINDISSPYGNIDHIVIGKNSGVFLLETKGHGGRVVIHSDRILVNDNPPEKDFIAQVLKNTYWLRDEIEKITSRKTWITPVIVFTNAFVHSGKPIKGVVVINKKFLLSRIQRQGSQNASLAAVWAAKELLADRLGA